MNSIENLSKKVFVVNLTGRLVSDAEITNFNSQIRKLREQNIINIILDLSQLDWLSSMGIGAFIGYLTSLRNAGGDLLLCSLNSKIKSLFTMTRLDQVFKIYEDAELAAQSFTVVKN